MISFLHTGVTLDPKKVEALACMTNPTNVAYFCHLLDRLSYDRIFLLKLVGHSRHVANLQRVPFRFTPGMKAIIRDFSRGLGESAFLIFLEYDTIINAFSSIGLYCDARQDWFEDTLHRQ